MVYLPQKGCTVACLEDQDAASSVHIGFSSHDVDSGKERGHSLLCLQPSWTWGGVTWTWVTPVDPSSTWQRCFGVNSKGKGATCWNATHDSLSNHLLLGDLLWYSLTWPNSSAAYEIQWAHCLRGHGFRPDRRNVTLKQYMCFSVCKRNSLERVKRMGENWEALCMSKIRACTRSKKEDKITSLQGKNTSSKVHLSYF